MNTLLEAASRKSFLKKLLTWYKKHGRHDMPWRKTKDPYAVLVSEFMLQQTTVATVRPYYDRFLKRFPNLRALAKAEINDVLALWSGLGYYARARNLWSAARIIVENHNGRVPHDAAELEKLPGIGPYTAGAIAAFAFNKPAAVLDGNVSRVLMRLLAIEDDPKLKPVQAILNKVSFDLCHAEKGAARHISLALMDLGSTVCQSQTPDCEACPGSLFCLAREHGRQLAIPLRGTAPERPTVRRLFAVITHKKKWLMGQRPKEGLFGGLWEFIGADAPAGVEPVNFLEEGTLRETGMTTRVQEAMLAFEHQLSHRIYVVRPFICRLLKAAKGGLKPGKYGSYDRLRWVAPGQVVRLGVSSVTKRIITQMPSTRNIH